MKKAILTFTAVVASIMTVFLSGCGSDVNPLIGSIPEEVNSGDSERSDGNYTDTMEPETEAETEQPSVVFDDPEFPLFYGQDDITIEGDRNVAYTYNCLGEYMWNTEEQQILLYSESGLSPAYSKATGKVGFINRDGEFVIDPVYIDAGPFSPNGLAPVQVRFEDNQSYLNYEDSLGDEEYWGYINESGEMVIPAEYYNASNFYDCGYAIAVIESKDEDGYSKYLYTLIDEKGNNQFNPIDERIEFVGNDYFLTWGNNIYNFSGELIGDLSLGRYEGTGEESVFVYDSDKYIPEAGYEVDSLHEIIDGVLHRYYYFYDEKSYFQFKYAGHEVWEKDRFKDVGLDWVMSSKLVSGTDTGYGVGITVGEKTVIPFRYDAINKCGDLFICQKYISDDSSVSDGVIDIYDSDFNLTAKDAPYLFGTTYKYKENYISVYKRIKDKYGIEDCFGVIDKYGNVVVPAKYYRGVVQIGYETLKRSPENKKIW